MKRYPLLTIPVLIAALLLFSCNEKKNDKKDKHAEEAYAFKGTTIDSIVFAESTEANGKQQNLDLDIYLPQSTGKDEKFPLAVYIHGGALRTGEKTDGKVLCEMLADKGFAVASINYRTGWEKGKEPCDADTNGIKVAFYRAMQDTRAALRFLTANASKYSADTNWLFVTGASAGGILSLATIYYPQDSANAFFGNMIDTLGQLDNYGNKLTTNYTVKAIASMWGGLNNPYLLTKNNALPTIFFHGEKDNVVPYDVNHFYTCNNLFPSYGAKPLYERLVFLDVPADAYIDPDGGHGVYSSAFRAEKIADFFHGLIKNQSPTGFHVEAPAEAK